MKRPSFQFYPSDWLRDTALRTCSLAARGLWIDMICYMHEGNPYGVLKVNQKVILAPNLAVMIGATLPETEGWLDELESAGVFDRGENGEIMSRRMIRDESLRNARASGGKLGGNPSLVKGKVNGKVNLTPNLEVENKVNIKPTPSSSSSSPTSPIDITKSKGEKFIKPTIDEVRVYCKEIGGTELDGEVMFYMWEGNGWMNGKVKVKCWKSTCQRYKREEWLHSQKAQQSSKPNGNQHKGIQETIQVKRL